MAKLLVCFKNVDLGETFEAYGCETCVKVGWAYGCELQYEQEGDAPSVLNFGQEAGVYVFRDPAEVPITDCEIGYQYKDETGRLFMYMANGMFVLLKGIMHGLTPGNVFGEDEMVGRTLYEVFPECSVVEE